MFISWSVDLQPHLNDCSDKSKSLETKMLVGAVEVNCSAFLTEKILCKKMQGLQVTRWMSSYHV